MREASGLRRAWGTVFARASIILGIGNDELKGRLTELGRQLGPPWREDQKLATLVAWLALN
jgi:hypothetical protein